MSHHGGSNMPVLLGELVALCVLGNTELPEWWTLEAAYPIDGTTCSAAPVEPKSAFPWTGDNEDYNIAQSVGGGSEGLTCSFNPGFVPLPELPAIYHQGYVMAASQSFYNGRWTETCDTCADKNEHWQSACAPGSLTEARAAAGDMCGRGCGQCVLIAGPAGSSVFMVNEIEDVNCCGDNGQGIQLHPNGRDPAGAADERIYEVRSTKAARKDIQIKRVPCPVEGGVYVRVHANYGTNALYFHLYNYRIPLASVHIRGAGAGGNATWVPLARRWTNLWIYEGYDCKTCAVWQRGLGAVNRGGTGFEFKLVSEVGEELLCGGWELADVDEKSKLPSKMCVHPETSEAQQFLCPSDEAELTACDGSKPSNIDLYKTIWKCPTDTPVPPPATPGPENSTAAPWQGNVTTAPSMSTESPEADDECDPSWCASGQGCVNIDPLTPGKFVCFCAGALYGQNMSGPAQCSSSPKDEPFGECDYECKNQSCTDETKFREMDDFVCECEGNVRTGEPVPNCTVSAADPDADGDDSSSLLLWIGVFVAAFFAAVGIVGLFARHRMMAKSQVPFRTFFEDNHIETAVMNSDWAAPPAMNGGLASNKVIL
ncbi:hypothetical protein DIPPA_33254 [Diplonema papillatum]|nr:hypothetical protein DIPPA_33254 [Diplonema papillatum]